MNQILNFNIQQLEIRPAVEADFESLASLVAERGFDYPTEPALVRERLKDLNEAGDCILIAVYNLEVTGMVLLHRTRFLHRPPDGRISALVVSEKYRSCGIGTQLVAAAESVFRRWKCARSEVTSGPTREGAHKFYIREGYSEKSKRFIKLL